MSRWRRVETEDEAWEARIAEADYVVTEQARREELREALLDLRDAILLPAVLVLAFFRRLRR